MARVCLAFATCLALFGSQMLAGLANSADIRKGMTANEVRQQLGPPVRVTRQVLYRRHIEQWVYENPQEIRVQFSCVRGEEPVVTGVIAAQPTHSSGKN